MEAALNTFAEDLTSSVTTALIDWEVDSKRTLQPKLLVNNYKAGEKVLTHLQEELRTCTEFSFSVAFVAESGLILLADIFEELAERDIRGRILTGTYLAFNNPKAFRILLGFPNIETRVFNGDFHAKGYLFKRLESTHLIVGSANLTDSALTANQEWSLALTSGENGKLVADAEREFNRLWNHESTQLLTEEWIAEYAAHFKEQRRQKIQRFRYTAKDKLIQPNAMQAAALSGLKAVRDEGKDRALLISATGTGKTYLSAFDVRAVAPKRVLFVVHRERIARDAKASFERVLPRGYTTGLYAGGVKDHDADCVFCTVQTLSREANLKQFAPCAFDYIIIDEVHRAGSSSYQRVLNYFEPKFLLGMSATPERNDGFDIYALFNHTVAYEIRLNEALENDMLSPFHYFGVHEIEVDGEVLDDEADFNHLTCDERVRHVAHAMEKYGFSGERVRGLVFCSRVDEARKLSEKFNALGYRTVALSGDDSEGRRAQVIDRLQQEEDDVSALDYIFTVDIFNEGVDIPLINQIVMLRPTQSAIIFVQQLGRGLRTAEGKEYVVVIDFIGNYKNNYLIPVALFGDKSGSKERLRKHVASGFSELPGASTVSFDRIAHERVLDNINKTSLSKIATIKDAYRDLKQKVGGIPTLMDFRRLGSIDPVLIFENSSLRSYHAFLSKYEADYHARFTENQEAILRFVSCELAEGKRSAELLILRVLSDSPSISIRAMRGALARRESGLSAESIAAQIDSALHVLSLGWYKDADKSKYVALCLRDEETIKRTPEFEAALHDAEFVRQLDDLCAFGLARQAEQFGEVFSDRPLTLYQRYSRKDACRILCWDKDDSSTVYGYLFKTDDWVIFVTLDKADDIAEATKYLDGFESTDIFNWMTKHGRTLESKEAKLLRGFDPAVTRIHLFVKLHDGEGADHYYLGTVHPDAPLEQTEILNDKGEPEPILKVRFRMDQEVRRTEYLYLNGF